MTDTRYTTIAEMWECKDCGVEGKYGKLGIFIHDLRHHHKRTNQDS